MNSVLILNLIYIFTYVAYGADINDSCGGNGWIAYENGKCFKLIEENTTHDKAVEVCGQQDFITDQFASTLASINSPAEQDFLIKYIFNFSVTNNIWIGARRQQNSNAEFEWNDGSIVKDFTYWAKDSPSNESGKNCVSLHANKNGIEWRDVSCATENWVLCQKLETWSLKDLQQSVLGANKELQELRLVTSQLTSDLNEVNEQVKMLLRNPIPVGFIYTQLPSQGNPYDIWGFTMWWEDITADYAGLFFRVLGGGSADFNVTQTENNNRLTDVNTAHTINNWHIVVPPTSAFSEIVASGEMGSGSSTAWGLRFIVSGGEVRPRNTAVRIWKRIH